MSQVAGFLSRVFDHTHRQDDPPRSRAEIQSNVKRCGGVGSFLSYSATIPKTYWPRNKATGIHEQWIQVALLRVGHHIKQVVVRSPALVWQRVKLMATEVREAVEWRVLTADRRSCFISHRSVFQRVIKQFTMQLKQDQLSSKRTQFPETFKGSSSNVSFSN